LGAVRKAWFPPPTTNADDFPTTCPMLLIAYA
jgi:hypothetical protein